MKTNKTITHILTLALAALALCACGTKRAVTDGSATPGATATASDTRHTAKMDYLRRVTDNAAYAANIVSKIKVTVNTGSQEISVAGSLHMRRNDVIRIQLTPLGLMEAGRLEFTKDYVLLVDRINKEYVKASYADVDFLKNNGLDFYALQAIFWNQLFIPGTEKLTDSSLNNFSTTAASAATTDVTLTRDKMLYRWTTDSKTARISNLNGRYNGTGSTAADVNCAYATFKSLGSKAFPTDITLTFHTAAVKNSKNMSLRLQLNSLSTESGWETRTNVSSRYRQVSATDILGKLLSM